MNADKAVDKALAQLESLRVEETVNRYEIADAGGIGQDSPPPVFTQTDPKTLKPHPQNSTIYGLDEDV